MIKNDALKWGPIALYTDAKDPTGFVDHSAITVTYNATARTITLAGTLDYYYRGVKKSLTSPWTSSAHAEGNGVFYLSSTDGDTFAWSTSLWNLYDIQVAVAVVSGTHKFGLRECHGMAMAWNDHLTAHLNIGTYRLSGGTLDGNTYAVNTASDAANTPGFLAAVIMDEDLATTIPAWAQGTYTTMYIGGSSAATLDTTATLPFRHGASFIYVNNATAGTEAAASNNRYLNVYQVLMPVTADTDSQKYRMLMLQPQAQYSTLAAAQAEDPRGLVLGTLNSLAPEFILYARITYVTANGDSNNGKCRIATGGVSYLAGSKLSQVAVSGYTTVQAGNVTVTAVNATAVTNLQLLLEEFESRIAAVEGS